MKFLYFGSHGSENPTKATIPFLLAKGAVEAGHQVDIVLHADAVVLFNPTIAESVTGVGFPPLKELLQFVRDNKIPVYG